MFEELRHATGDALERVETDTRAALVGLMSDGTNRHRFLEDAGQVVAGGGAILVPWLPMPQEPVLKRVTVLNVYTEPSHRQRGLARRVMRFIINWCRDEGLACVQLHASDAGRPLYASLGFLATNEMRLAL
jgi:GNAT superfamily N-acetyltransferase